MRNLILRKKPVLFIAEIGGNHEGDFEYAKKLSTLAIEAGVNAVKFQIYRGDTLVSRIEDPDRNRHFKKFELTLDQYIYLAEMCKDKGVMFMASIWDKKHLKLLDQYVSIHKVGSGDITAYPLIKAMVETGKPIILSTGLCRLEEVRKTIEYISGLDKTYIEEAKLALLQCTTSYPCPDEDINLNAMLLLRDEFGLPVGYSDHTIGSDAALAAATMGADILEMHFTDTREGKTFRDHSVSITSEETKILLERISRIKVLQGRRVKEPTRSEIESKHVDSFRRSVYALHRIKAGETFNEDNLTVLRPQQGVPAYRYDEVLGCVASRDIEEHEVIKEEDLE